MKSSIQLTQTHLPSAFIFLIVLQKVNFTSKNFAVCFDGFYHPQVGGDCLLAPPADNKASYSISPADYAVSQLFLQNLPSINTPMKCLIAFGLNNSVQFAAANFGSQAALVLQLLSAGPAVVDVLINGTKVHELNVANTDPNDLPLDFLDISGCRHEGVVYKPGTTTVLHERCEIVHCNETAVLSVSTCGPMQICLSNNTCDSSITAPTIITAAPLNTPTAHPTTNTTTASPTSNTTTVTPSKRTTVSPTTNTTTANPTTITTTARLTTITTTAPPIITNTSTARPITNTTSARLTTITATAPPITNTSTARLTTITTTTQPTTKTTTAQPTTITTTAHPATIITTVPPITNTSTARPTINTTSARLTTITTTTQPTTKTTTAQPTTITTTAHPATIITTVPPITNTSTVRPTTNTTTERPITNTTTVRPITNTTTARPITNTTTSHTITNTTTSHTITNTTTSEPDKTQNKLEGRLGWPGNASGFPGVSLSCWGE
ncbi:cell wall protein DAN4 [Austrofundulus limnaeus]|uniref:Cell wall protein DAN4 n=1 Tax=Austrofundulus limnaeus TaxID=52670 RepID=A0A2I4CD67_AUSLI|nr:PREDICTED: cell wall protein DAN4-like [Austrofundulus limnaeus]